MSKELEKFKKEWKKLDTQAGKVIQEFASHCTNRDHHKQMLLESAKEIGRVVQALKDGGKDGSALKDFAGEKEMQPVMKTVLTANAALGKEEVRLKKILGDCAATTKALQALNTEIDTEVKARKKKKDRKLLAIDSKSLPEMEKLLTTVATRAVDLNAEVKLVQDAEKWSAAVIKGYFDKWAATEIGKTKASRKERDQDEKDDRGLDNRLVKKAVGEFKKLSTAIQTACGAAEKHFKNKELEKADAQLAAARKYHTGLKKIAEPYERKLSKLNKYDRMGMEQSKDGKFVLDAVEQMQTAIVALDKLIKKISRATV